MGSTFEAWARARNIAADAEAFTVFMKLTITEEDIIQAATTFGGSFDQCLAKLIRLADDGNLTKIKATWPEFWVKYTEFASINKDP